MSNLVVIFPGLGYTSDRPLLHFGKMLAKEAGYDDCHIIKFEKVNKEGLNNNPDKMHKVFTRLFDATKKSLEDIDWLEYNKILFISKSIGTVISAAIESDLQKQTKISIPPIKQIFFTPLEPTFDHHPQNAIGFIGTDDAWCEPARVITLAKEQYIPINVYEGANHSLETGDTLKDLDNLKDIFDICKKYI